MCRILGYLGPPTPLADSLFEPVHSLARQAIAPQRQAHGRVNTDGWGVAWWASRTTTPERYRVPTSMWTDHDGRAMAQRTRARAYVASVRNASPGLEVCEANTAPYRFGRYAFTHNGYVDVWDDKSGPSLRERLREPWAEQIEGGTDSEILGALVLQSVLDDGVDPATALAAIAAAGRAVGPARCNFLLSDGAHLWATRSGDTLYVAHTANATLIASEPIDAVATAWREVPDDHVVTCGSGSDPIWAPIVPAHTVVVTP